MSIARAWTVILLAAWVGSCLYCYNLGWLYGRTDGMRWAAAVFSTK